MLSGTTWLPASAALTASPRFDASPFDTQIAGEVKDFRPAPGVSVAEGNPAHGPLFAIRRLCRARRRCCDSGLDLDQENRDEIGVIIGSGIGGLATTTEQLQNPARTRARPAVAVHDPDAHLATWLPACSRCITDLRGPNFATCSACATANHAIGEAWRTIKMGDAQVMFAGGAEATIVPIGIGGFCAMKAMSTRNDDPKHASRPFDKERDGFVMGEGAGVLVLEELEHAKKRGARIYCEIVGYGNTADAHHVTAPSPAAKARPAA